MSTYELSPEDLALQQRVFNRNLEATYKIGIKFAGQIKGWDSLNREEKKERLGVFLDAFHAYELQLMRQNIIEGHIDSDHFWIAKMALTSEEKEDMEALKALENRRKA